MAKNNTPRIELGPHATLGDSAGFTGGHPRAVVAASLAGAFAFACGSATPTPARPDPEVVTCTTDEECAEIARGWLVGGVLPAETIAEMERSGELLAPPTEAANKSADDTASETGESHASSTADDDEESDPLGWVEQTLQRNARMANDAPCPEATFLPPLIAAYATIYQLSGVTVARDETRVEGLVRMGSSVVFSCGHLRALLGATGPNGEFIPRDSYDETVTVGVLHELAHIRDGGFNNAHRRAFASRHAARFGDLPPIPPRDPDRHSAELYADCAAGAMAQAIFHGDAATVLTDAFATFVRGVNPSPTRYPVPDYRARALRLAASGVEGSPLTRVIAACE